MKRVTVTFEDETYAYLKERAKSNHRQTSGEINAILSDLKNPQASITIEQLQQARSNAGENS